MVNESIRKVRTADPLVRQSDLARELKIGLRSYIYFEVYDVPLPRGLTPSDVLAAIDRLRSAVAKAS